jgi:hypothetical protein
MVVKYLLMVSEEESGAVGVLQLSSLLVIFKD